mmetsp:Transcript_78613/g.163394  ORF Transcript_78613/g.163394 Transcript_78613/m.163394 type:complete len:310 (+) Transcript_78613:71-1000(+)
MESFAVRQCKAYSHALVNLSKTAADAEGQVQLHFQKIIIRQIKKLAAPDQASTRTRTGAAQIPDTPAKLLEQAEGLEIMMSDPALKVHRRPLVTSLDAYKQGLDRLAPGHHDWTDQELVDVLNILVDMGVSWIIEDKGALLVCIFACLLDVRGSLPPAQHKDWDDDTHNMVFQFWVRFSREVQRIRASPGELQGMLPELVSFAEEYKSSFVIDEDTATEGTRDPTLQDVSSITPSRPQHQAGADRQHTTLHQAAAAGDIERVKHLVEQENADVRAKGTGGDTALSLAAGNGHLAVVKYLTDQEAARRRQ